MILVHPFLAWLVVLLLMVSLLTACFSPPEPQSTVSSPPAPAGSCGLDLDDPTDEAAIMAVLEAEGDRMVAQDLASLLALWAEDGEVIDVKHTPEVTADDQRWQGKDALRHRYVYFVFPGAPAEVSRDEVQIAIEGREAVVISTTQIDSERSIAGDRWELVKQDGCWLIKRLTFNLERTP
jgi:hypothetical protein